MIARWGVLLALAGWLGMPVVARAASLMEMHDVAFRFSDAVIVGIDNLRGVLLPARAGAVPNFDRPDSMVIRISAARVTMGDGTLTWLLNHRAFAYPGSPLSEIRVTSTPGRVKVQARLKKGIAVGVELEGTLAAHQGKIALTPTSIKANGVAVRGLLDLLGIELAELIQVRTERGVAIAGDRLILDPQRLLPPPRIEGAVTAATAESGRVRLSFGSGVAARPLRPAAAGGYLYFRGGALRFGKLTMHDADLEMRDGDADRFHFYLARYARQLVAGTARVRPNGGLLVTVPDFDRLAKPKRP